MIIFRHLVDAFVVFDWLFSTDSLLLHFWNQ